MLAESYFDETNTHQGDDRLCVGGYVFHKENAEKQAERWGLTLTKWGLPYFHMVECAHNTGIFEHLSKADCDLAAREAIQIIKETASSGVCMTILESDYLEIMPRHQFLGSAYDACARDVITGVAAWIENTGFEGAMHYFFEAGTMTENNASYCILQMMKDPELRQEACYAGHSFVCKEQSAGVQAADLLAWHAGQDCKRAFKGLPIRKDFASLCEIPHRCVHITREMLRERAEIVDSMLKESGLNPELVEEMEKAARRTPKGGGVR